MTVSKRVDAKTHKSSPRAELDIVAIKTNNKSDLPLRIAGEVKSYGIHPVCFEKLDKKMRKRDGYISRDDYSRYKWVNNKKYRKDILNALKKEYGEPFEYVLFCAGMSSKYEQEIKDFLKGEGIHLVLHKDILAWLFEDRTNEYTDNQILQLIRLIKKNTKKLEFD